MFLEKSQEIPSHEYFRRVLRALGERSILKNIQGLLIGRPKTWEFNKQNTDQEKEIYKIGQRDMVIEIVRKYNQIIPIVQNLDFGHTSPQIPLPVGKNININSSKKTISAEF